MAELQQHFLVNQTIQTGSIYQTALHVKDTAVTFASSSSSFQTIASAAFCLLQTWQLDYSQFSLLHEVNGNV